MEQSGVHYVQVTIQTWQAVAGLVVFVFAIGAAWGNLHATIKGLDDGLKKLADRFDGWIHATAIKNAAPEGRSASPMVPSEKGTSLLAESGVRTVIDSADFKSRFFQTVDGLAPKSGYATEQSVFSALLQAQKNPEWDAVKEYVFNHPVVDDRPMTMERLLVIASWILRDEYMASRKIEA